MRGRALTPGRVLRQPRSPLESLGSLTNPSPEPPPLSTRDSSTADAHWASRSPTLSRQPFLAIPRTGLPQSLAEPMGPAVRVPADGPTRSPARTSARRRVLEPYTRHWELSDKAEGAELGSVVVYAKVRVAEDQRRRLLGNDVVVSPVRHSARNALGAGRRPRDKLEELMEETNYCSSPNKVLDNVCFGPIFDAEEEVAPETRRRLFRK